MRTCKRKNPLNIRYSRRNMWKGQIGNSHGFCSFISMEYGCRAALVLLRSYIRRGFNTIELIVNRWAPPTENNTEKYISFVAERTGIGASEVIAPTEQIKISAVFSAMAWMETMTIIDEEEAAKIWHDYI